MDFHPGDKVKSNTPGTLQTIRTLKRRVPEQDNIILGECWEFEEDYFHPYDWDKFYVLVERPSEKKEQFYCANCGIPIEDKEDVFCSGGCCNEFNERSMY